MKIMINAGHDATRKANGLPIDSGAVNFNHNVYECDIAREISLKVVELLKADGHQVVFMQQDNLNGEDGYNVKYSVCYQANVNKMDLFISIHTNSHDKKAANGTECLVYELGTRAGDLADCIQNELVEQLDTFDRGVRPRSDLCVLADTNMPAVLVEPAFISNEDDFYILTTQQNEIAEAIARGINTYIEDYA